MSPVPKQREIATRSDAFQVLDALRRNRRKRAQAGRFLVEGVRSIDALRGAPAGRFRVDAYLHAASRPLSRWALEVLAESRAREHLVLADELMAELSDKDDPSELLALVDAPETRLADLTLGEPALVVVADRLASPGNLGTLIRSCDAFGVDALVIHGHAADPTDSRVLRAAAGSWFALPIVAGSNAEPFAAWLEDTRRRRPDLQVVGSSANASDPLDQCPWTKPTVLVLGSERAGLSHAFRERCDTIVSIPLQGTASSLNVACAASVLLYEVARHRSAARA